MAPSARPPFPPAALLPALLPVLLLLVAALPALTPATASASDLSLQEARRRIGANGWNWEASDALVGRLTPEQRRSLTGFVPPPDWERILKERERVLPVPKTLPSTFSWLNEDGITPVRDQGSCGSCWAFAATAEMEARILIEYGVSLDLSEQQVIACNPYGSDCGGGWAGAAYYVFSHHGAIHEHCQRYEYNDIAPCTENEHPAYGFITGWHSVPNDMVQIKTALLEGPVCTAMDTGGGFDLYGSGCYDDGGGYMTDHLVLIVGWDDRLCDGEGAWIIKNSWGTDFGMAGYAYVKYGAALVGSGCTQLEYTPPPTELRVITPLAADTLVAAEPYTIRWQTVGAACPSVDIWFSRDDYCFETQVADDLPNSGEFEWLVPNLGTRGGRLVVQPHTGTADGFGFAPYPIFVLGHRVRYVSAAGSDEPPYESPATAAHTIGAAVQACTGQDTVMVAEGEYFEGVTVSTTVRLIGGWSADFGERDPALHPTRMRSTGSAVRFMPGAGDFGGVEGFVFHDCLGGTFSDPVSGRHGGAIYSRAASPEILDCVFLDNMAAPTTSFGLGGAILVSGGSPLIAGCRFERNLATRGGAVALVGVAGAVLRDNRLSASSCSDSTTEHRGGGLWISGGSVASERDTVEAGAGAGRGGGIAVEDGVLSARDLVLRGNRALGDGGGLLALASDVDLVRGEVVGNSCGGNGGGLYAEFGPLDARNLLVRANAAANIGAGGFLVGLTGGEVANCAFADNVSPLHAGLFLAAGGPYRVRNNLATGNAAAGLSCSGTELTCDYNDAWDNAGPDFGLMTGPHDISADALLVDPAAGDWALGLHSPCLDRGDPDPAGTDPDGGRADIGLHGGPDARTVAPPAVTGLEIGAVGLPVPGDPLAYSLLWDPSPAPDAARYVVYGDTTAVLAPGPGTMVGEVLHPTTIWDLDPPEPGHYWIVAVDADGHVGGYSEPVTLSDLTAAPGPPAVLAIAEVAPNPFNPSATIRFDVPVAGPVRLDVYDARGRRLRELVREPLAAGRHARQWDGRDDRGRSLPSGVYLLRLQAGGGTTSVKTVLVR